MAATDDEILSAAATILERDGVEALTTRAVCQAAGVTAPTLYHHFGDKDGLVRALVERGIQAFFARKRANKRTDDPLADLKRGWEGWIDFAVQHPRLFQLMVQSTRGDDGPSREAYALMRDLIERLGTAGRLSSDVDTVARTVWAASSGVLTLFMQGASAKEIRATSDILFEALVGRLISAP